jgi:hypothetical protein
MTLPPLYTCFVCGMEINMKAGNTLKLLTGWAKGPNYRTLAKVEREEHKFCHDFCLVKKDSTGSLF